MYTFDETEEKALETYEAVMECYERILRALDLQYVKGKLWIFNTVINFTQIVFFNLASLHSVVHILV